MDLFKFLILCQIFNTRGKGRRDKTEKKSLRNSLKYLLIFLACHWKNLTLISHQILIEELQYSGDPITRHPNNGNIQITFFLVPAYSINVMICC